MRVGFVPRVCWSLVSCGGAAGCWGRRVAAEGGSIGRDRSLGHDSNAWMDHLCDDVEGGGTVHEWVVTNFHVRRVRGRRARGRAAMITNANRREEGGLRDSFCLRGSIHLVP